MPAKQTHTPSVQEVLAKIRSDITMGNMAPNQRLIEADLVDLYGATRGTVRNALKTLAVEGLIEHIPNRGARVRAIHLDEALEIAEIRAAIEGLCAARAAQNITDTKRSQLRKIGTRMQQAVDSGDAEDYSVCNQLLHQMIMDISGMKVAPDVVNKLRMQNGRFQIRLSQRHDRPAASLPEHLAIIEAVCSGNPEIAANAMRAHLMSVREATKHYYD